MLDRLIHALVQTKNEAADDVLLEALRLGADREQRLALAALLRRKTVRGLGGVIAGYDKLPEPLQLHILRNIKSFHPALREYGRSDQTPSRLAALKLIALGHQGRLAYVLSESLHHPDETVSKAATEALVALARWVATETRALQKGERSDDWLAAAAEVDSAPSHAHEDGSEDRNAPAHAATVREASYLELTSERPEVEAVVARAMDVHRGRHGQDLLRAALLLCDWPGSKTLAILKTAKHGGQGPMVRRLQQPPSSEHVEAFLLGASHGQLRSHFGVAFSHIAEAPVLDALLRKTHWLKDHQLQLCVHQVSRGAWWEEGELSRDLERRSAADAAKIAEWIASSGVHDVIQDDRLEKLRVHARDDFDARLRLLRVASRRKKTGAVGQLRAFLSDPDERLVRMAVRELVRRRPPELETMLLQKMTGAPESVRRVIGRAIGQAGFEHFWQRFDRLPKNVRRQAGRAMLKILPDGVARLQRRMADGPAEQRVKAIQMAHELGVAEALHATLVQLCNDVNPRIRSKAVAVLGEVASVPDEILIDRLINDGDARVRANTIEALEARGPERQFMPVLAQRAREAPGSRERANAIKALHSMKVSTASSQLLTMLRDERPDHRVSALWALRQIGWWQLLGEVGRLAKSDANLRVRRYALGVLRGVAEVMQAGRAGPDNGPAAAAQGPEKLAG